LGWDTRCLTQIWQTGTVHIRNTSPFPITFRVSEWHSQCGWPGGWKQEQEFFMVPPHEERILNALNEADQFLCRENFVFDCRVNAFDSNSTFDCNSLLETFYRTP
jgi:hypothetical protein